MKEKITNSIVNLLKVKSIITLLSFTAFFYLSITGKVDVDNFMLVMSMIATYFFNKDNYEKKENINNESSNVMYEVIDDE